MGISTIYQGPLTVPCTARIAVQGDCERVYSFVAWEAPCTYNPIGNRADRDG